VLEEERAYTMRAMAVAKHVSSGNTLASFTIDHISAHREGGGAAILNGPAIVSAIEVGSADTDFAVVSSGNSLLFLIANQAGETYHWDSMVEFIEIKT